MTDASIDNIVSAKRDQQGRLSLLSTSYCVGLLVDGLDCDLVPDAIRGDVEDIRGRLTDIVVQLDHLSQK